MNDTSYYRPLELTIAQEDDGKMALTVLTRRLGVSRKLLSRLKLTAQGITLNGQRIYTTVRVSAGDVLAIRMEQETSDDILPEALPLDIVFEDEALLVVNKPPGLIVHPTHGHYTGTLANAVVHHWQIKGERVRFRPIHRLDQETSGIVVIAKNPYVHQQLSEQLQRGEIDKQYAALVYCSPPDKQGTIAAPIDRDDAQPHLRVVRSDGYASVTHYTTEALYADGQAAFVRLKLETGRTHQIRVHMLHVGCPLIGDKLYRQLREADSCSERLAAAEQLIDRHALHAGQLTLTHPYTGERFVFTAPFPADMAALRDWLASQ